MADPEGTERRAYRMHARARELAETRERIIAAARVAFLQRPFEEVTLRDIAESAEVTRQTVLNHFESKDGVFLAAAESVVSQRHLAGPVDEADALDVLVAEYEEFGDAILRLLAVEERFTAVRTWLERGRRGHRAWVESTFAEHLAETTPGGEAGTLALVAATDVYVWKLLRRDLGSSRDVTREVIGTLVAGALEQLGDEAPEVVR